MMVLASGATVTLWHIIGAMLGVLIVDVFAATFPAAAGDPFAALASTNPSAWLGAMSFAALFVDLPVMALALTVLFVWKAAWSLYRLLRLLYGLIPMFA